MDEPIINITTTETRKFFKNQVSPKELATFLLELKEQGKIDVNLTSANDSDIPNYIEVVYYTPTQEKYENNRNTWNIWLSNFPVHDNYKYGYMYDDKWRNNFRWDNRGLTGDFLGWVTKKGVREEYQNFYNLYPQGYIYKPWLKYPWKKQEFPFEYKEWYRRHLNYSVKVYDYIIARERFIVHSDFLAENNFEDNYRTQMVGDCMCMDRNGDTVEIYTANRMTGEKWDAKLVLNLNEMTAKQPANERPVAKTTLDKAYTEGDMLVADGNGEGTDVQWFYIESIDPEAEKATLVRVEKEVFDVGKPYSIYKIYARPKWKYRKNRTPLLTNERFEASYDRFKDKDIHFYAPELDKFNMYIKKWTGGDVLVQWVDHSG